MKKETLKKYLKVVSITCSLTVAICTYISDKRSEEVDYMIRKLYEDSYNQKMAEEANRAAELQRIFYEAEAAYADSVQNK